MFLIKNSQLETLSAIGREDFIKKMMKLLRDDYEEIRKMPLQELHDDIDKQIDRANGYGFSLNACIATYIVCAFAMGESFDTEYRTAIEILTSSMHEIEKSKGLENWIDEIFSKFENQ